MPPNALAHEQSFLHNLKFLASAEDASEENLAILIGNKSKMYLECPNLVNRLANAHIERKVSHPHFARKFGMWERILRRPKNNGGAGNQAVFPHPLQQQVEEKKVCFIPHVIGESTYVNFSGTVLISII